MQRDNKDSAQAFINLTKKVHEKRICEFIPD